jgi:hypothetical protein
LKLLGHNSCQLVNGALVDLRSHDEIHSQIEFYLRLNKDFRRKHLLSADKEATHEEWVNTIVSAKEDTAVVYYFLSQRVSLLLEANRNMKQVQPVPSVPTSCSRVEQEPAQKKSKILLMNF